MAMHIISALSRHSDTLERPKAPVIDIRRPRPAGPPDRLAMIDTLESTLRRLLSGRNLVYRGASGWDRRLTLRIDWHPRGRYWDVRTIEGHDEPARLDTLRAYVTVGLTVFDVDYSDCDSGTCRMEAEMFASAERVEECARMWARQTVEEIFAGADSAD